MIKLNNGYWRRRRKWWWKWQTYISTRSRFSCLISINFTFWRILEHSAQCWKFGVFLSFIFSVKFILGILEVQNLPFSHIHRLRNLIFKELNTFLRLKFSKSQNSKPKKCHFLQLIGLWILWIWSIWAFKKCKQLENSKSIGSKYVKMADFALLESPKMISRKI